MRASALPLPGGPHGLGRRGQRLAGAALGLSLAVHLAALGLVPDWRHDTPPTQPPMRVTLLPPPTPAPAPAPVAAVAPPPVPAASPQMAPTPRPVTPRPVVVARQAEVSKAPRIAPAAVPAEAAPLPAPASPPIAAETSTASPPPATRPAAAPHAAPGAAVEAAPAADPAALARYGQTLSEMLARQQKYPRLAATRGWEGEVVLKLIIARKGQLVGAQVIRSSGHAVLDESALALVTAAQPFPAVPGQPGGDDLEVTVPVHYRLRKS